MSALLIPALDCHTALSLIMPQVLISTEISSITRLRFNPGTGAITRPGCTGWSTCRSALPSHASSSAYCAGLSYCTMESLKSLCSLKRPR